MTTILQIKVKPNARQSSLTQADDGAWVAQIKSVPVDGKDIRIKWDIFTS